MGCGGAADGGAVVKPVLTVHVSGLREIEAAMMELSRSINKRVARKVLVDAGRPLADLMRALAPEDEGDLKQAIDVGTRLTKHGARVQRRYWQPKPDVEAYVGVAASFDDGDEDNPDPVRHAHITEFGSAHSAPFPFARPAWDADKMNCLYRIKQMLGSEVQKAILRARAKAAKAKG